MGQIDIYGVTFHSLGILASDWKEDTPVCRCYLSLQDKLWKFSHFAHDQNVEERKRASGGEFVIAYGLLDNWTWQYTGHPPAIKIHN